MKVDIKNVEHAESEVHCMFCGCNVEYVSINAVIDDCVSHAVHAFSCLECPNITFEYYTDQDTAVLNEYLIND